MEFLSGTWAKHQEGISGAQLLKVQAVQAVQADNKLFFVSFIMWWSLWWLWLYLCWIFGGGLGTHSASGLGVVYK